MSKEQKTELPGNLKGYKLKKDHGHLFTRIILWAVIIIVILWFINKQIVLDLFDRLRNLVAGFL